MPTLSITKSYSANNVLRASHLDDIRNSIQTFINSTKLDGDNIQISAIADDVGSSMTSTGADAVGSSMTSTGADAIGSTMSVTGANAVLATVDTVPSTQANLAAASRTRAAGTTVSAGGVAISNSCGFFSVSGTVATDVTNLSVTITTSGRPVQIMLIPDGSANQSSVQVQCLTAQTTATGRFLISRDASQIGEVSIGGTLASASFIVEYPPSCLAVVDAVGAGTYTYKIQAATTSNSVNILAIAQYSKLVAYEL